MIQLSDTLAFLYSIIFAGGLGLLSVKIIRLVPLERETKPQEEYEPFFTVLNKVIEGSLPIIALTLLMLWLLPASTAKDLPYLTLLTADDYVWRTTLLIHILGMSLIWSAFNLFITEIIKRAFKSAARLLKKHLPAKQVQT